MNLQKRIFCCLITIVISALLVGGFTVGIDEELAQRSKQESLCGSTTCAHAGLLLSSSFVVMGSFYLVILLRQATRQLQDLAKEMSSGASEVSIAAEHVSSASQTLAQGSIEQAASIEQTSGSRDRITDMTRRNATNAQSAAEHMAEVDRWVTSANTAIA